MTHSEGASASTPSDPTEQPLGIQVVKLIGLIVVLFGLIVGVMNFFVVQGRSLLP